MNKGTKHDQDKPDLSQLSLELVTAVAEVRMFGAKKYSKNNWRNGFHVTRSCSAALRHIFQFLNGEDVDSESGLSHLGHAVCCLEHAIYDMKHHIENDDRYKETKDEPISVLPGEHISTYNGPESSYDHVSNLSGRKRV